MSTMHRLGILVLAFATFAMAQTSGAGKQRLLRIGVRSDVRFILTDPAGRSAGFDRNTGLATTQIPSSTPNETCSHTNSNPSNAEPCFREIEIRDPAVGEYRMAIVAPQAGNFGLYWSDETKGHLSSHRFSKLPISTGELQVYDFKCAADPAQDSIRGDFMGEQAEGAADDFLTWGRPSSASVELKAGSNAYEATVVYGATIDPATFRARLNGNDVSGLFHPAPQKIEPVRLPLRAGKNILKVTVNGRVESHTAVDTDTLEFRVQ